MSPYMVTKLSINIVGPAPVPDATILSRFNLADNLNSQNTEKLLFVSLAD